MKEWDGRTEWIEIDVIEGLLSEKHLQILPVGSAVGDTVHPDVLLHVCDGGRIDVIGDDVRSRDLVRDTDRPGTGRGHTVRHLHLSAYGTEQHDADIPVECHLLIEEHVIVDLSGSAGRMLCGNDQIGLTFPDYYTLDHQIFSPFMRLLTL